jgi:hypothetical protein
VSVVLKQAQALVRREERQWARLQGLKRQFAFQGAVALVVPWGAAALAGSVSANPPALAGAGFQALGLVAFQWFTSRTLRESDSEARWLAEFLTGAWLRVSSGSSLGAALAAALDAATPSVGRKLGPAAWWRLWLRAVTGAPSEQGACFAWPEELGRSRAVSEALASLLRAGAPAGEVLSEWVERLEEDRQEELEERIGALPVKLSLCFCLFFTPAVFLILFGALWPSLSDLMK